MAIFLQVMGKQMNSELLNKILEEDMISLSSDESDVDLLWPDLILDLEEDLDTIFHYRQINGKPTNPPH